MIRISRNGVIVWSARPHSKDGMVEHNDEHSKKTQQDRDQLAGVRDASSGVGAPVSDDQRLRRAARGRNLGTPVP